MNKPFVCCTVIVNGVQQYLLIKRANELFKDQWSFISGIGASKRGLLPINAAKDEVAYDIGAEFRGELQFAYILTDVDYADKVYVFLGYIDQNAIRLNPKAATEYKWFNREELETKGDLAFSDRQVFDQINGK